MLFALLILVFGSYSFAKPDQYGLCDTATKRIEEDTRVFILTASPGSKTWSSFGHNLIWISNGKQKTDESFNFGTFDPQQQNLLYRYLNGELIYWLDVQPFMEDLARYKKTENRTVVGQRLRLPPHMIEKLVTKLSHLRKDENKEFVYHWSEQS